MFHTGEYRSASRSVETALGASNCIRESVNDTACPMVFGLEQP